MFGFRRSVVFLFLLLGRLLCMEVPQCIHSPVVGCLGIMKRAAVNIPIQASVWPCFLGGCAARRILVPQPGIESRPLALEAWSLNNWTTREFPCVDMFLFLLDKNLQMKLLSHVISVYLTLFYFLKWPYHFDSY